MSVLGLGLLGLTACGGPPAMPGPRAARVSGGEHADGCAGARLAGRCWSAEGTRWQVAADGPGGAYRFELELMAAGRVRATDDESAGPATDEWFQEGPLLRIFLSDRFVEYRALVTNGTVLLGEAVNVRGQRWSWRADRVFGDPGCPAPAARVGEACLDLTGTRWWLEAEGVDAPLIELMRAGRLGTGGREADDEAGGTWEQDGDTLRFTLGEARVFVATLEDANELRGRWREGEREGQWRASRIESIPPILHR